MNLVILSLRSYVQYLENQNLHAIRSSAVDYDVDRMVALLKLMKKEFGFKELDKLNQYSYFDDEEYFDSFSKGYIYPTQIESYILNLSRKCPICLENGSNCENDCSDLSRYPIKKRKNMRCQIIRLERM